MVKRGLVEHHKTALDDLLRGSGSSRDAQAADLQVKMLMVVGRFSQSGTTILKECPRPLSPEWPP